MELEEALAQADVYSTGETEEYCMLESDTSRVVVVPEIYAKLGVESDEKVKRIKFKFPKIVDDNKDLTEFSIRINYKNANGEYDKYICEDVEENGEYVTFSWELWRKVTKYKGTVNFIVCAVKASSDGTITNEWNTTVSKSEVLEGLEVTITSGEEDEARDILTQLLEITRKEILEEGNRVLEMIPEDYTQMQKDIDLISQDLNNYYIKDFGQVVGTNNYSEVIPDLNEAKENKIYRLNFANNETNCPKNLPEGLPNGNIMTLMVIKGITYSESIGICQILYTTKGIYKRWTTKSAGSDTAKWVDWICIASYNGKTIKVHESLIDEDNLTITDVNNIIEDCIYRFNFSGSAEQYPKNMPEGFPNGAIWTLINIQGSEGLGKVQLVFSSKNSYIRNSTNIGWGNWSALNDNNGTNNNNGDIIYYVGKNYQDTDDNHFNNLSKAIINSNSEFGVKIYVEEGEYNIASELKEIYGEDFLETTQTYKGLVLNNNIHITFSSKSKVTFHYDGSNEFIMTSFSPFNAGQYGFTLENMTLDASRCRYCVHDERSTNTVAYYNKYLNCNMRIDTRNNTAWKSPQCIGGGLGVNGNIIIKDSVFESVTSDGNEETSGCVSYHNSASKDAKSNIVMSGCYIKGKGCARFSWYGESTELTNVLVFGNSFGSPLVVKAETEDGNSQNENIKIFEFNNEIRGVSSTPGKDGREVELQNNGTAIQWRYLGESDWKDLVQLSEITGKAATVSVGNVTTGEAGTQAFVQNTGTESDAVFDFTIPKGKDGNDGVIPNIQIGEVTTLEPGQQATASVTGSKENPLLNLGIPKGQDGVGGGSAEKEWKLVKTITLEEDVKEIFLDTDDDMQNFSFEEFYVISNATNTAEQSSNTLISFDVNNKSTCLVGTTSKMSVQFGKTGESGRNFIYIKSLNPLIVFHGTWISTNTSSDKGLKVFQPDIFKYVNVHDVGEKIKSIKIYGTSSTSLISSGSKFEIYGR